MKKNDTGIITLAELRAERDRVEKLAREHALATALEYYLPGVKNPDTLRGIVFGNWLQEHAFTERFEPLDGIGA
jgi:hypothetical protein